MADLFNFSKNMTLILTPALKEIGFKRKGSRYIKDDDINVDIFIQRSSYNFLGDEKKFYFNIEIYEQFDQSRKMICFTRLRKDLFSNEQPQKIVKIVKMDDGTEFEVEDTNASQLRDWCYSDEEELKNAFKLAIDHFFRIGVSYIEYVKEEFINGEKQNIIRSLEDYLKTIQ